MLANVDLCVSAPVGLGHRVPLVLRREYGGIRVQGEEGAFFPLPEVPTGLAWCRIMEEESLAPSAAEGREEGVPD